jgi:hypothetical protein
MSTRNLLVTAGVGLGLIAATACASAQQTRTQAPEFRWNGRLQAGQAVEIRGLNGNINAERSSGSEVEVVAIRSGRRSDPASVTIQAIPSADGVTLCALYPTPANAREPNECRPGSSRMSTRDNDVQVDFTVRVPDGVRLLARSTNGGVTVVGLTAEVNVSTTNGDVRVSTSGIANVSTTNGSITATLGNGGGARDLSFSTTNGDVSVSIGGRVAGNVRASTTNGQVEMTVAGDTNANVRASTTNGSIQTDFPITVQGRYGPRNMEGQLGSGGGSLVLTTTNGDVRLRKQ